MPPYIHICPAILLLLLPAYPPGTAADNNTPETPNTSAHQKISAAEAAERKQTANRFAEEIKRREAEYGIYDAKTAEYLLSIGLLHQAAGNHSQAIGALARALQIQRVNDGLQSASQLIILEQLIKSHIASENWAEVDKNFHQLLWINRRNYDPGDPRLLPVIDRVGRWKLKAYKDELLAENPVTTLQEAASLFTSTIAILDKEYGAHAPLLVDALYGEALTNYQVAFQLLLTPLDEFHGRGSPDTLQTVCTPIRLPNGRMSQSCRTIRVPNPGYYAGRQQNKNFSVATQVGKVGKSLKRIIAIHEANPTLPRQQHAMALVHLGDWNLLQNRRTTALRVYTQAYQLLAGDPASEEKLQRLFGKPVSIPALHLPLPEVDKQLDEEENKAYALATFDVSQSGTPKNITIIETHPPASKSASRKAKKSIKARRYRPRFVDGQPVETTGNRIRVLL